MNVRSFTVSDAITTDSAGGTPTGLQAKAVELSFDATWSPYVQGSLTCVTPIMSNLLGVDPRAGRRTRFTITQDDLNGTTHAADFNLPLRSRPRTASTDETELRFASDESLWQDWASGTANPQDTFNASAAAAWAAERLGYVQNVNFMTLTAAPDVDFVDNEADWDPGVTAWDYASQLAEVAGAWLFCDELGVFYYAPSDYSADSSTFPLDDVTSIKDVTDDIDRGAQAWANYVIVEYTKNDPHKYAVASSGSAVRKTVVVQRDRKKPGNGNAAQTQLNSFMRRGRTLQIDAVADIRLRPNRPVSVSFQGESHAGLVQRVEFSFPAGTMRVLVNVIE